MDDNEKVVSVLNGFQFVNHISNYLLNHESDIAEDINDFGDLRDSFVFLFDREPNGN